jgi:hypothetical protein
MIRLPIFLPRRYRQTFLLLLLLLLMGCATSQPIPDWFNTGYQQLERYKQSYLGGKEDLAAQQFSSAVSELKKSGNLDLLARAYLTRMALGTATLEDEGSEEYQRIDELNPDPRNRSYVSFLRGDIGQVNGKLLPPQYEEIFQQMATGSGNYAVIIGRIKDPFSRLICTGILIRLGREDEAALKTAVDAASGEGWKKALLVYLNKLQQYYENRQEQEKALAIGQRIRLIND